MDKLVNCIRMEIQQRSLELGNQEISTIYFGGGTPSILSTSALAEITNQVKALYKVDKDAEITLEANPEDLTEIFLQQLVELGINRLSIGIQSFNDEELKWMNRNHTSKDGVDSVKRAFETGIENISVDLIYGSKFQDERKWAETLQCVFDLPIKHLSAYNLTIEKKTVLGVKRSKGAEPEINEQLSARCFQILMDQALQEEFEHYEISNFAKQGFRSQHNSSYWSGLHYLGFGPGAHSFDGQRRRWNKASNSFYISAIESGKNYFEFEQLTERDRYNEYIMTSLRTAGGVSKSKMKFMFSEEFFSYMEKEIQRHILNDWVLFTDNSYRLTQTGKHYADRIASDLFYL